ncbi:Flagellin protein FlaA [Chitinispirillum alkaliphilum]|nr:Flagellin protein FlaA [Chitinispirillum alkaliphilum]
MSFDVGSLNRATNVMSRSFVSAGNDMGRALERISSGSRINRASDDFSGYASIVNLSNEAKTFQNRAVQLREQSAVVKQAQDVADQMLGDLYSMKTALENSDTELAAGYGVSVSEALKLQSHNNVDLINDDLVSGLNVTGATGNALGVTITSFADENALKSIGADSELAHVNAAIGELEVFIKELQGFQGAIESHTSLAEVMSSNSEAVSSAITAIDEAEEMARYVEADIRQQAAVAMFSQANMSRRNISLLYR